MRVFGHPRFLNLYRIYFQPLLEGIDTGRWDLDMHLLTPAEMPVGGANSSRPHFQPPRTIRIPIVEFDSIYTDVVFRSNIPIIGHELGHFVHEEYMGADGSGKWYEFASLIGEPLDFAWRTTNLGGSRHPYPHVPAYELFADCFSDWLLGRLPGPAWKKFYLKLWGQKYMAKIEMWIDKKEYTLDGERLESDVAPELKDGRTMVPLRLVAEALGGKVQWIGAEQKIIIEQ